MLIDKNQAKLEFLGLKIAIVLKMMFLEAKLYIYLSNEDHLNRFKPRLGVL